MTAFHRSPSPYFRHVFPHLEHWASMHFVLGHKLNSHAPSCVGRQQLPKLLQAQFLPVDLHDYPAVLITLDQATQHATSGNPLITSSKVFDLLSAQGHFECHML